MVVARIPKSIRLSKAHRKVSDLSAADFYKDIVASSGIDPAPDSSRPDHDTSPHNPKLSVDQVIDAWGVDYWAGSVLINTLRAVTASGDARQVVLDKAAESATRAATVHRQRIH